MIWPFGPAGHSPSRSARSARSSRTSAQRRSVRASQAVKRAAASRASRVRVARADRAGRPREPGADRVPAARGDPDQDVDGPGAPQRLGELHGQLGLAGAAHGHRHSVALTAVYQHHGLAGKQARFQVDPGLQALEVGVGQRRDDPRHQHLRGRRRSGTLRDHVDSLSRGTPGGRRGSCLGRGQLLQVRAAATPRSWPSAMLEPGPPLRLALLVFTSSLGATIPHVQRSPV